MIDLRVMDPRWLKEELAKDGRSQAALARFLGYDFPEIVNRMCSGKRQIKSQEADRIREYLATHPPDDPTGNYGATVTPIPRSRSLTAQLVVRGTVEAGSWREVGVADVFEPEVLTAPKELVDAGAFGLRVVGPSMDLRYPHGSMIIVVPWDGPPPVGKRVVVERTRPGGLVETSVKELVRRPDGELELWPRSTHPAHQAPIPFGDHDDVTVRLLGVVRATYLPED